jgi:hypothetical protein
MAAAKLADQQLPTTIETKVVLLGESGEYIQ